MEQFRFMAVDSDEPMVQRLFSAEGRGTATTPGYELTVGVTHVQPGAGTDALRHRAVEAVAVVSGTLRLRLDEEVLVVSAGDGFLIPAGAWHSFRNTESAAATMLFAFGGDPAPITERVPVRHAHAHPAGGGGVPTDLVSLSATVGTKEQRDEGR